MGASKKLFKYCIVGGGIIVSVIIILLIIFKGKSNKTSDKKENLNMTIFSGVPSDAIMVFYFDCLSDYRNVLLDTSSFAYGVFEKSNPMVDLQNDLLKFSKIENVPFIYSLHYSSKNSVSFLQILDFEPSEQASAVFSEIRNQKGAKVREYNGVKMYTYSNGLNLAIRGSLLLASNSPYVLESSIRHFANNTSMLDNQEFATMVNTLDDNSLIINNKQIGKFFSGEIDKEFLSYSDFFHNFSNWSLFNIFCEKGKVGLSGYFYTNKEVRNFATIFNKLDNGKSDIFTLLPPSTIFLQGVNLSSVSKYREGYDLYMDINKKLGKKIALRESILTKGKLSQPKWLDSLGIKEVYSAYCKFGDKSEWITFMKDNVKEDSFFSSVMSKINKKDGKIEVRDYIYKGYIASLFGDIFSHCNEEAYCKVGDWAIIGPKKIIAEFAHGNINYYSFEDYIKQTPASRILDGNNILCSFVNLKESPAEVLAVFKPYLKARIGNSIDLHNFEFLDFMLSNKEGSVVADMNLYAMNLEKLPVPKVKETEQGEVFIVVDSTINIFKGPFEVYNSTRKAKGYFEQLPNLRLRLSGADKKGIWAIPFETPLCGSVEQVDLFANGKNQMMFISDGKLYALDMLARFVNGYPVKLQKEVVFGPVIVNNDDNEKHSFLTLNIDNSISRYDYKGKKIKGWKDIKAPEFVKELPTLLKFASKKMWLVKLPSQMKLYNYDGSEFVVKGKNRVISKDCEIEFIGDNQVKVKGNDGKYFTINLSTGETKKVK